MYRLKTWNASSSKGRLSQSFCQCGGRDGITSGMNNPLSGARPLRTTSSKESCPLLAFVIDLERRWIYATGASTSAEIYL
jgi:hypothetical protein